jgi:hypothetical protein
MAIKKTKVYLEFEKAMKDSLAKFSASEQSGMRIRFVQDELKPLGKKLRLDEYTWTNYLGFLTDKSLLPKEKDEYFAQWTEKWKMGAYDPTEPVKQKKKAPAKRGNALDDIVLDETKPEITKTEKAKEPELPINSNTQTEALTPQEQDDAEASDEAGTLELDCPSAKSECNQSDWDKLPLEEKAKRTIAKQQKPKPKEKTMPKTKQELLTELLSSSDGLSEEEVKRVATDTFCDLISELTAVIREGGGLNAIGEWLAQVKMDNKND